MQIFKKDEVSKNILESERDKLLELTGKLDGIADGRITEYQFYQYQIDNCTREELILMLESAKTAVSLYLKQCDTVHAHINEDVLDIDDALDKIDDGEYVDPEPYITSPTHETHISNLGQAKIIVR